MKTKTAEVLDFSGIDPMKAYSVSEAARMTGIGTRALYDAVSSGRLKALTLWGSKRVWIKGEELLRVWERGFSATSPE